jgi:hypothetical protein
MSAMPVTPPLDLDHWLPRPQVRTCHRRTAQASPAVLWDAAATVRLSDTGTLGRLVRWRIPGVEEDEHFRAMFAQEPFTVLAEGGTWSVSGLVGRIWTLRRDYPSLEDADAFRSWDRPDTVRVLFAHWAQPDEDGRSVLVSEARVAATDRRSSLRLRGLWAVMGPFERLIGGEALAVAATRAEQRTAGTI